MPSAALTDAVTELVSADAATLAYGTGEPVVTELDLRLPAGELVVVLGPNGGGKTTFFRALAGELEPRAGAISVAAPIAYLPQYDGSRVDFPVSALDVVLMGMLAERRFWQRARRAERERARAALALVGLEDRANRSYGELSGGQRRRVLLARTIVSGARVIALDEPLAGVDPRSAEFIRGALGALRDEGRLVLEASHDIEHARGADRVLCLNHRLIADGRPGDVLTDDVLRRTYEAELTVIPGADGAPVLATADHCGHEHR